MPQGLQVWDASGTLVLDTSTSTLKTLINLGEVTENGSTTIAIPAGATPVISVDAGAANYPPVVTRSGNTISWSRPAGAASMRGRILVDLV